MDKPLRETFQRTPEPFFSQPVRQIVLMLLVVALASAGLYVASASLMKVFVQNPYLNGFILLVFLIGVVTCFLQVFQLIGSVNWIEDFVAHRPGHEAFKAPSLLAPLASLLRSRGARSQITPYSSRSILDSVATRVDESRDITRYLVNLLIFLGLLGTFFGLATTVPAVVETIKALAPKDGETGMAVFDRLMNGLESQLGGMGMAFSSSLLGLSGSLLVGMLELFAGHGQNRFYRELEEWLSTITRVGMTTGDGEAASESGAVAGALDQMAEQMEVLQTMFVQADVSRALLDERLGMVVDAVGGLMLRMAAQPAPPPPLDGVVFERLVEGQARMVAGQVRATEGQTRFSDGLSRIADAQVLIADGQDRLLAVLEAQAVRPDGGDGVDAESRMRLRSIDVQLLRILEEISAGRSESIADLRSDLAALTAAIRQLSRGPAPQLPRRD